MTGTDHPTALPPGPPGRGAGWTVTTDATAARAAAVTGASGWRRPEIAAPVRRSFATEAGATVAVAHLRKAGHSATLTEPLAGTGSKSSGMRLPPDVWDGAKTALEALEQPRTVTVTVQPGMSRSGAVTAFLGALAATGVSAEEA